MVPSGWCFKKLSELACSSKNSFAIGPFGSDLVMSDYRDEGTPIVFVRDIKRGAFNWVSNTFVDIEKAKSLKAHSVKAGDITITKMGLPPGIAAVYPESMPDGIVTADIIRLRLDTANYDASFICLLLNSYDVSKQVKLRTAGQTRPKLTLKDYKSIGVCLPKLDEQRKIAKILSTWDKAVATTEQLIETSKQQKKALMQQLLTGKKRLVNPETGKVFEDEWEKTHLKPLLVEEKSRNKDNRVTRVLSVTNHSGFVLPEEQFSKRVASDNISNYKVVKKGQFGYNPSRLNVGSFACLKQFNEGVLSPMYVVFSTDDTKLQKEYLSYWMQSNEAKQRVKNSTQGSVRESVGFDALCSFPFILPTLDEQNKVISVLTAADKEIEVLEAKLAYFKQEKKALMQQLLTGKRRVKVEEMEVA
ncbi:TPA: restriction endonuclease subunit S [Vibrio parahaemolyticus]|nr:restriction endonuclease subunit S [Vibrio parahaemolyticus]HBH7885032.1 restriction endonuclease subunit S [Vibrio parahaemolyticus]